MVFFSCNVCGESLKKNAVEKHYMFKCRDCSVLSCIDCGKDFPGDSYQQHIKCISEEEKYSGKNYTPRPNANKGEQKQEAWTEQVLNAIQKANANPRLRNLLQQIQNFSNIPRKKAKFENFLKNSQGIRDVSLINQAWDLISAAAAPAKPQNGSTPAKKEEIESVGADVSKGSEDNNGAKSNGTDQLNGDTDVSEKVKKKKKKRKHDEIEQEGDSAVPETDDSTQEMKKKKKKKKKHDTDEEVCNDEGDDDQEDTPKRKKKKKKDKNLEIHKDADIENDESKTKKKKKNSEKNEHSVVSDADSSPDGEKKKKKKRKKEKDEESMMVDGEVEVEEEEESSKVKKNKKKKKKKHKEESE